MTLWIAVRPKRTCTKILVTEGVERTLLKANLARDPAHPRALATFLEAIALWQCEKAHAVLCADESAGASGTKLLRAHVAVVEPTPLFHLDVVPDRRRRRERDRLRGLSDFRDLRQLLVFEVAR